MVTHCFTAFVDIVLLSLFRRGRLSFGVTAPLLVILVGATIGGQLVIYTDTSSTAALGFLLFPMSLSLIVFGLYIVKPFSFSLWKTKGPRLRAF